MSRSKRRPYIKKSLFFLLPLFLFFFAACSDQFESDSASIRVFADPAELMADGSSATELRALILDPSGEPVYEDTRVVFRTNLGTFKNGKQEYRARTTNDDGVKVVTLISGTTPGNAKISVKSQGVEQAATVRFFDPLKKGSVEVEAYSDTLTADGEANTQIKATVRGPAPSPDVDPMGGEPVEGIIVTFTTTLGEFGEDKQVVQATTDVDGEAIVNLTSEKTTGTAKITAEADGLRSTTSVEFVAGKPDSINLRAVTPTILPGGTTDMIATVLDVNENPVVGEDVVFEIRENQSGGTLESETATTNVNGEATVAYFAGSSGGTDKLRARSKTDAAVFSSLEDVTVDADAVGAVGFIGSMELEVISEEIVADGTSSTAIRAVVQDFEGNPVAGRMVEFTTSGGALSSTDAGTNENGVAEVILESSTRAGVALVIASIPAEGFSEQVEVRFVPGPPVNANSSITVQPSTIPADGESTAEVIVTLADAQGNPIPNETEVGLYTSRGKIITENPALTDSGRASFTIEAPSSTGTAEVSVWDYPDIRSATLRFGSVASGEPSSIFIESISHEEIAVTGVGKNDNTAISLRIVDEAGTTVVNTGMSLRASLLARPDGGEFISGEDASGRVVRSIDAEPFEEVQIGAASGEATLNLRSGSLPGVVEVRIEVLQAGESLSPPVVTVSRQFSIASGPPHTIVLSAPQKDAVVNLNEEGDAGIPQTPGFYSRRAGLIVTDRHGNAVPDGTTMNLGVIDSVISQGDGRINEGEKILSDASANFNQDWIRRDDRVREIQPNDRVILFGAAAADKSRFVQTPIGTSTLPVNRAYTTRDTNIEYAVGASLLGATIYGTDGTEAVKGTARTENGLAQIRLVYPANSNRILTGCYGNPATDTRHQPAGSARVISLFISSDDSASLVDEGTLCFSAIAPAELTAEPDEISEGDYTIRLTLRDGGDEIRLPFVPVTASVSWGIGFAAHEVTVSQGSTNEAGVFESDVTVTRQSERSGWVTITYFALGARAEVSGYIPSDWDGEE